MKKSHLDAILNSPLLDLTHEGDVYKAAENKPLSVYIASPGGDILRLTKIKEILLDENLVAEGLLGLQREEAFTIISAESIFAVELDNTVEQQEKRKTGFA